MRFEIGKAYQHHSGMQMFICGFGDTVYHGICFIAENGWQREKLIERMEKAKADKEIICSGGFDTKDLSPISMSEDGMENWFEIPKSEFVSNNTSKD